MNLILGANGFIGRRLHQFLAAHNKEVIGTHFPAGAAASLGNSFFLDVTKPSTAFWHRLPPLKRVFVCIQHGSLDDCRRLPASTAAVNVRGLISALQHIRRLGGAPVFLSSSLVFAGEHRHYSEHSRPSPTTQYGRQKLAVEKYIRHNFRHYCIARLTKVYSTNRPDGYLFRSWLLSMRRSRPITAAIGLVISPIWIADIVRALSMLDPYHNPGIYHFAGPDSGSPAHYAQRLARHFHLDETLVRPQPADTFRWLEMRPKYNLLDDHQTRQMLKLRPAAVEAAFDYQLIINARQRAMLPL